ncbi:MAG: NTPase [Anaerolineales bacterium]|nr:NTPase [Anaerolineales bacterium]
MTIMGGEGSTPPAPIILLTGRPGSGKTTVIMKVLSHRVAESGGFYTEEIRERGRRVGFRIVTLDGRQGILAHINFHGPSIGRYGVDLAAIDGIAVESIRRAMHQGRLIVIDEIGPMEVLSEAFRQVVYEALDSDLSVLGSIVKRNMPFTDAIKATKGVMLMEIHPGNRDAIVDEIVRLLSCGSETS